MRRVKSESRRVMYAVRFPQSRFGANTRFYAPIRIKGKVRINSQCGVVFEGELVVTGDGELNIGSRTKFGAANGVNRIELCNSGSRVSVGNDYFINGARLAARKHIEIGNTCILGDCRIVDSDFHSTGIDRCHPDATCVDKPVVLSDNVWISNDAIILKGVHIGMNSVVGAGAVVRLAVPANAIVIGNPATVVKYLIPGPMAADLA